MSYEKTQWETGDKITAEKLNNMEDGIAYLSVITEPFIATYGVTTEAELVEAWNAGKSIWLLMEQGDTSLIPLAYVDLDPNSKAFSFELRVGLSMTEYQWNGSKWITTTTKFAKG